MNFYPIREGGQITLPTIDAVEVEGYVYVPTNIPTLGKDNTVYDKGISVPIAQVADQTGVLKVKINKD